MFSVTPDPWCWCLVMAWPTQTPPLPLRLQTDKLMPLSVAPSWLLFVLRRPWHWNGSSPSKWAARGEPWCPGDAPNTGNKASPPP